MTSSLYIAVKKENVEIVELLLQNNKIDINIPFKCDDDDERTPLFMAIEKNNVEIVKLLLSKYINDINFLNKYYNEVLEKSNDVIIDRKINVGAKTVLYHAIEINNVEIVKLILNKFKNSININTINFVDDYIFIEDLIDGGEKEEYKCFAKKTALFQAIEKENIEIIKLLLQFYQLILMLPIYLMKKIEIKQR